MVVQHNLTAMNSNRMLGVTTGAQKKSSEKLSSGYKINRAADDAAGLSISEKMRRQIRGLTQASANAEDGISAVQTAEGALNEVHDMLQRMNELANKAANGTNSKTDRQSIQDEISQLTTEIDRVSETTKFNELYLMKGGAGEKEVKLQGHDAGLDGILSDQTNTATFTATLKTDSDYSIGGKNYHIYDDTDTLEAFQDQVDSANTVTINGTTYKRAGGETTVNASAAAAKFGSAAKKSGSAATKSGSAAKKSVSASQVQVCAEKLKACAEKTAASAAKRSACATKYAGCVANIKACADKKTACAGTRTACAEAMRAKGAQASTAAKKASAEVMAAGKDTCAAALKASAATIKGKAASLQGGKVDVFNASAEAISAKGASIAAKGSEMEAKGKAVKASADTLYQSADDLKASAAAMNEEARKLNGEGDAESVKFIANEKEYLAGELKSMIVDGAKVGINGVKERTAVDTVNNLLNKTLDEVKGLIKDALNQANRVGVDDTTAVSVTDATDKGGDQFEYTITKGSVTVAKDLDFNLHVGADADLTNKIGVGIAVMDSKYLGVHGLQVVDDSGNLATYAIDAIEDAITKVNEQRSALGAVQNRLEHTIKNVDNVVENTTAAESQIRDTDMASEMVRYSNNNILMQAGQSMLAQANQSNQGVLSLLG